MCGVRAGGDALLRRPKNCVIEVIADLDVHEVVQHRVVIHEGGLYGNLAGRHGEGVLAVLFGELDLLVVLVQNRQSFQNITLVRRDRDGHRVALGGGLGTDGNGAVVSLADRHAVGGDRAAATAAGGGTRIDSQGTLGNCTDFIISPRFSLENRCGDRNVEAAGSLTIGGGGGTGQGSKDVRRLNAGRQIAVGHGEGGECSVHGHALVVGSYCDDALAYSNRSCGLLAHGGVGLILCGDRCRTRLQRLDRGRRAGSSHLQYTGIVGSPSPAAGAGARIGHRGSQRKAFAIGLAGGNTADGHACVGLIHELEGQRSGDVRIVLAADGDGPVLIRCSRDARLAGVGEIAGCICARVAHHVAGVSIRNRICDLRLGRSGGEEIGCRQRTCLYTGIVLQNIHRLGGSGVTVSSLVDLRGAGHNITHAVGQVVVVCRSALQCNIDGHIHIGGVRVSIGECSRGNIEVRSHAQCAADTGDGHTGDGSVGIAVIVLVVDGGCADGNILCRDVRCCRGLITAGGQLVVAGTGTAQSAQSQINGLAIAHISIREGASSGNGQAIAAHNASNGRAGGVDRGSGAAVILFVLSGDAGNGDFLFLHDGVHGRAALMGAALVGRGDALAGRTGLDSLKRDCFGICIGLYQLEVFLVAIPAPLSARAGVTGLRCRQDELLTIGYGVR